MKAMIQRFIREEDGASAVEYGLLVARIAVVIDFAEMRSAQILIRLLKSRTAT